MKTLSKIVCVIIFLLSIYFPADSEDTTFFLAGSTNNRLPRNQKVFFLKKGDNLTVYPIIRQRNKYYTTVEKFISEGNEVQVNFHLKQLPTNWYQVAPVLQEYDNTAANKTFPVVKLKPITYQISSIPALKGGLNIYDVIKGNNYGTYYLTPSIKWNQQTLQINLSQIITEVNPLQEIYPHQIIQIVYRPDDSYLGYLSELYNTPFILGPRLTPVGFHQTDSRVGSDCAAFAIYGKRRQGYDIPYCGPKGIVQYLREISNFPLHPVKAGQYFIYYDKENHPLKIGPKALQPGDIIHFTEQVSVFYQDQGFSGLLDQSDLILQSYIPVPQIIPIAKTPFSHHAIRVYKWKK